MTATNEMPGVIYVQNDPEFQGLVGGAYSLIGDRDEIRYHHTAALIERIEGMKRKDVFYNTAIQDVIDILKGENQ